MVITIYISGISGNKEVKKRQQRVTMILESRGIEFECIDIADPSRQEERDRLKTCGATPPALPPQLFNGDVYCGDYDQFDLANENDTIEEFLKLPPKEGAQQPSVTSTILDNINNVINETSNDNNESEISSSIQNGKEQIDDVEKHINGDEKVETVKDNYEDEVNEEPGEVEVADE